MLFGALILGLMLVIATHKTTTQDSRGSIDKSYRNYNIILIVIDATRADHLECYGYARSTAPNICGFAEEGVKFNNMFATTPSTKTSVGSLFTSLYPGQHHAINNTDMLSDNLNTLMEVIKSNNYSTYAVNSNVGISSRYEYNQGADLWIDVLDNNSAENVNKVVFDILEQKDKQPFFMYIHYVDPHDPYLALEPYSHFFNGDYEGEVTGNLSKLCYKCNNLSLICNKCNKDEIIQQLSLYYDNEIAYVDHEIGELLKRLKDVGVYNNTIIVITADHGELFMEHGYLRHSNGLYSEVINVPLIIRDPRKENNISVSTYVSTIDIFPTIIDLVGVETNSNIMGESVFDVNDKPNRDIFLDNDRSQTINPQIGVISEGHKLIKDLETGEYTLFDIEGDPQERNNIITLSSSSQEHINILQGLEKAYRPKGDWANATDSYIDEEVIIRLKSLGYL